MYTGRFRRLALSASASLVLSACGGQAPLAAAEGQCSEQIILSLSPGYSRSDKLIKELSRGSDVRLQYLRSSSPNLFVYVLTAEGKDPSCKDALARLRQDSRVRFAEIDGHRAHFN